MACWRGVGVEMHTYDSPHPILAKCGLKGRRQWGLYSKTPADTVTETQ